MKYTYLLIDLCVVLVPLIFSFHSGIRFYRNWKSLIPALIIAGWLFAMWDSYFTFLGVWGFNKRYITGIMFGNLPIEEVLFFICIPFACMFTYYCLKKNIKVSLSQKSAGWINIPVALILISLAIFYRGHLYTFYTFIFLALLIAFANFVLQVDWLIRFYCIYIILLVPFFIVNGLLTGTGLAEPVVWYNQKQMIGLRLLTIPIEDFFYGMALILLNLLICNFLERESPAKIESA
jgi:lycopene cyclase domain-containing protein